MNSQQVHSFTTRHNGISRVLFNEVEISQAFNPSSSSAPTLTPFRAIWDTGATNTVITENVVKKCGLQPIDIAKIHTAGGERLSKVYLVCLGLPNRVMVPVLRVSDGELAGDADVLVGMDIIAQGDFAISNYQGKTTFTFRMPSLEEFDFNERQKKTVLSITEKYPGTHRNARCPCGSGRKYKNCCQNPS